MILSVVFVIIGIVLLIQGANWLVKGASGLARSFGVSPLFIGLTVVAFGTSAPELAVSISAALKGIGGIAISNVVGSNIANVALVIGFSALLMPTQVNHSTVRKEIPFNILVGVALMAMLLRNSNPSLDRIDGIVLIVLFVVFMEYTFEMAKRDRHVWVQQGIDQRRKKGSWGNLGLTGIGLVGVVVGGDFTVQHATEIARMIGMSEAFIGLTMVAIGTSLPELVTSLVAAIQKQPDLAIGNIIGSNLFNVLMVLGLSSAIRPISMNAENYGIDLGYMVGLTCVILIVSIFRKNRLGRLTGLSLLASYACYLLFITQRG